MASNKSLFDEYLEFESNRNTNIFGDSIDAFQAGLISMGAGMAEFVGADETADKLDQWAQDQSKTMTPAGREAMAKRLINDDLSAGEGLTDWRTWWLTSMNVLGGMSATIVPGGVVAKGASLASKGAKLANVGGRTISAGGAAGLGTNAVLNIAGGGGQAGRGVEEDIKALSFKDLRDSEPFQNLSMQYIDEGLSPLEAQTKARDEIAEQAGKALTHDFSLAAVNGTLGPLGDHVFGQLVKGQLGKTIKGALAKGIVMEGGTEAIQGGVEKWRGNVAANDYAGTDRDEMEGVAAASLENGLLGAVIGSGASASGHGVGRIRRRNFESKIEKAITPNMVTQLRDAGNDDQTIRSALQERVSNKALELGFDVQESKDLAQTAIQAAFGDIPPAAERHAAEGPSFRLDGEPTEPQVQEQPQAQSQPQFRLDDQEESPAAPQQNLMQDPSFTQEVDPAQYGLTPEEAELLTDPPAVLFNQNGHFAKNAPKELKQRYYVAQNREGAQAYIDAVFDQSGAHSRYYDDMVKPTNEPQSTPIEPQQNVAADYPHTELSQEQINRIYGLAPDYQPTDAARRVRESSGIALRDELMHQQGDEAAPNTLSRDYSDMDTPTLDAKRVRYQVMEDERQAQHQDQLNQQRDEQEQAERARDEADRARDIERGFAAQDSFDRESQRVQKRIEREDRPQTQTIEQDKHYFPRERRERVDSPVLTEQDMIDQYRGQRSGFLKGELLGDEAKRNARQSKKLTKKLNAKQQVIYDRIQQNDPVTASPTGTEYLPNNAMADAFARMKKVHNREVMPEDVTARLEELEESGAITAEDLADINEFRAQEAEQFNTPLSDDAAPITSEQTAQAVEQLGQQATDNPKATDEPKAKTYSEHGVDIEIPAISKQLEQEYNRAVHVWGGRDFNEELQTATKSVLENLNDRKLLDTAERKAKAKELIETYLGHQVDFIRWSASRAASNPSWIVTGRSNRNMDKYNEKQRKFADEEAARITKLTAERDNIPARVSSVVNEEQRAAREAQARENTQKRLEKELIDYLINDIFNPLMEGKAALASDARKWALPKAAKALTTLAYNDQNRAIELMRLIDKRAREESKGKWGLKTIVGGRRSAIGKKIEGLLGDWESIDSSKPSKKQTAIGDDVAAQTKKNGETAEEAQKEASKEAPKESLSDRKTFKGMAHDVNKALRGEVTFDEMLQLANDLEANEAAIREDLTNHKDVKRKRTPATKRQLIESAVSRLTNGLAHAISPTIGSHQGFYWGTDEVKQVVARIRKLTPESFAEILEARKADKQSRIDEAARAEDALKNPVTLSDFNRLANSKNGTIDAFSDAQLKAYDQLVVNDRLERKKQQQKAAAEVAAVDGEISYQLAETIHTKKQIPMYVVQLTGERMGKEAFKDLAGRARQLGGNYVNAMQAKRYDTIDGFQFANKDDRDNFARLLDGDKVSAERRQTERLEAKTDSRVARLLELADSQEEKAHDVISIQRQTNTARRASMAASAIDRGYTQQETAQTIRAIAENVDKYQVLSNLSQLVQLDELNQVMRSLVWKIPEGEREKFASRNENHNWVLKPDVDIDAVARYARFPAPIARKDFLLPIAEQLENVPGYKQAAQRMKKLIHGAADNHMFELTGRAWEPVTAKIREFNRKGKPKDREYLFDRIDNLFKVEARFSRMGINGPAELRHALRELADVKKGFESKRPVETPIQKLENKIIDTIRGNRNAFNDFFPTSNDTLANHVLDLADIQPGEKVLEPSAGMGHLADLIADKGGDLDVGDLAYPMRELLTEKGHNVVSDDFLTYSPGPIYDKIVMNPPFSNDAAITHINHALTMLKPGGRLVAITPINTGDKGNSANKNFREYLDVVAADEHPNDADAFVHSLNPTAVLTKTIVIDKPTDAAHLPVPDDIRFSQTSILDSTAQPQGMAVSHVKRITDHWLTGYNGLKGVNVTIVDTQMQLNELSNTPPKERVKGVWLSGDNRVVLVAENLADAADVTRTLRHELIGHNAMTSLLGEGMTELTNKVSSLRSNRHLKPIFESVDHDYKNAPAEVKIEEVIARLAEVESGPLKAMADKVMAFVMGALRKAGILANDKITLSEVRNLIHNADKYLRRADGTLSTPGLVRYSQTLGESSPDYGNPTLSYDAAIKAEQRSAFETLKSKSINAVKGSALVDASKGNAWGLLTLRQLAEVGKTKVSKDYGNMLDSYVGVVNKKLVRQNNLLENVVNLSEDIRQWIRKGNQADADALFNFMHDATLANVDPSGDYKDMTDELTKSIERKKALYSSYGGSNTKRASQLLQDAKAEEAMLKGEPARKKAHAKLRAQYNKLTADQKKHFNDIRDHYAKQQEQMYNALIDRVVFADSSEDMSNAQKATVGKNTALRMQHEMGLDLERAIAQKGFYVPLARFGQYWVSTKWDSGKKDRRTNQPVIESQFEMFESEAAMMERVSLLNAAGYKPTYGTNIEQSGLVSGATMGFVSDLMDSISGAHMGDDAKVALKDEVYQMYLSALPDRSIRKAYIHRKGTKGFSENALRALADQGFKQSRQQARLETEHELNAVLKGINNVAKTETNNLSAQRIASEINRRHDWVMNPKRGKLAQKLTGFGFFWMIGASPASAMINLTQSVQIGVPVIGAKYGMVKAATEMTKLSGQWLRNAPDIVRNAKDVRKYGVLGSVLSADERQVMARAIEQGVIDVTQTSDALELADKPDSNYGDMKDRVLRGLGAGFHYAEVLNREVTFMTAYRLAKQNGHENAYQYAVDTTWKSHFDYGSLNRARFMQGDVAAVALQFKQFSQNMTYYLMNNALKSLGVTSIGKNASKEERVQARRELLGTMAVTFALGGISALPLHTVAKIAEVAWSVAGPAMGALFGFDADEPFDAEVELKAWLGDLVGKEWADVIYRGVPPAVGLPAINKRINIDLLDMWVRDSDAQNASGTLSDYGEQLFGPIGSIFSGAARGMDYASEGRYGRAVEQMTPKWVRDVIKTSRYAMEGGNITNRSGDIIVSDVSALEYVGQALGFMPTRLADQYETNRAIKHYERDVQKRRSLIMSSYLIAMDKHDMKAKQNVLEQVRAFNQSKWGRLNPITSDTLSQSLRSHQKQKSRAKNGAYFNAKYQSLVADKFAEF